MCLQNWHIVSIFINVQSNQITTSFNITQTYNFVNDSAWYSVKKTWYNVKSVTFDIEWTWNDIWFKVFDWPNPWWTSDYWVYYMWYENTTRVFSDNPSPTTFRTISSTYTHVIYTFDKTNRTLKYWMSWWTLQEQSWTLTNAEKTMVNAIFNNIYMRQKWSLSWTAKLTVVYSKS